MGNCPYWNDYDSLNGRVCFCSLAAFNQPKNEVELVAIGCTKEKRGACQADMEAAVGFASIPTGISADLNPWPTGSEENDASAIAVD